MKILVINCGSSSLKFQLIDMEDELLICRGTIERIASPIHGGENNIIIQSTMGNVVYDKELMTHTDAFNHVKYILCESQHKVIDSFDEIDAIGHRVVQGGDVYTKSVLITPQVVNDLKKLSPLAPLHNPANIQGYEACLELVGPDVPQIAVFDTAFHSTMPPKAYMYAVPYEWYEQYGVRRYGFHGTSHKYVSARCAEIMGRNFRDLKLITCHLGNGASIAAIKRGKVIDTSMGFTPLDGFMMGTRSGGVDPSVVTFMMKRLNLTPDEMDEILNKESGVNAISGVSSDDRDIFAAQNAGHERAMLAHEMQAYEVAKYIGSYVAAMCGVDAIVFTGGIGENGFWLRSRICSYLKYLNIFVHQTRNQKAVKGLEAEISESSSDVRVYVIATNEELVIARDTKKIIESL